MKILFYQESTKSDFFCTFTFKLRICFIMILSGTFFSSTAQTSNPCGNLISNGEFNSSNYSLLFPTSSSTYYSDPFGSFGCPNIVPDWTYAVGSPQLNVSLYHSSPTAAMMWSTAPPSSSAVPGYEAVVQNLSGIIAGRPYIFIAWAATSSSAGYLDQMNIYLCDTFNYLMTSPLQTILNTPLTNTSFAKFTVCNFLPTQSWTKIIIHPLCYNPLYQQWLYVDDVKLIENFDFAGRDTAICKGSCITLGRSYCYGNDAHYEWYELPTTTPFDTNEVTVVCPNTTTTYVLKRNLFDCIAYDTINVTVYDQPHVNLGNDTTICTGYYTMTADTNSAWTYLWNPGNISGNSITVSTSGTYSVFVDNHGCTATDTINIRIVPEFHVYPDTLRLCNNDSAIFTVPTGFAHYSWGTGDTTNFIKVWNAGAYSITVTDSNGCTATAVAILLRNQPKTFTLGHDIDTCYSGCFILKPQPPDPFIDTTLYRFQWNRGDTTKSITVCTSGTYILIVTDTNGCWTSDTISVNIRPFPSVSANNIGPYCLHDSAVTLSGNGSPSGGVFSGNGVSGNTFSPEAAGVGKHTLTYTVTNSYGCSASATFNVIVKQGPYAEIKPEFACENDSCITLTLLQGTTGGTWSSNATGGVFCPSTQGPGVHVITYSLYDSASGCSFTARSFVSVGRKYTASWTMLSDPNINWLCEGSLIDYFANSGFVFKWMNQADNKIVGIEQTAHLKANGNYWLIVADTMGNCPDTAEIEINYPNCCSEPASNLENFGLSQNDTCWWVPAGVVVLNNAKLVIDKMVVVPYGTHLDMNGSDIIMKSCSKILVENGATLNIDNSRLGICPWFGIEASGFVDCCQDGTNGCSTQSASTVNITNHSVITNADIAVFAGLRNDLIIQNSYYIPTWSSGGAILNIEHSTFSGNYIDVLFREYDLWGNTLNTCTYNKYNKSTITYSLFQQTKDSSTLCDNSFINNLLSSYNNNPPLCHIMDLAQNSAFVGFTGGVTGQTLRGRLNVIPPFLSTIHPNDPAITISCNIHHNSYYLNCASLQYYK